ncbi:MAG: hypothetical protein HC872_03205, partial [Gammaproteobacteria bacterium]|nr:hypothetical protein [Gammaproteobacteria bacterium]
WRRWVVKSDELDELLAEQRRLANGNRLAEGARQGLDLIYEGDSFSANTAIGRAASLLRTLVPLDAQLAEPEKRLEEAAIAVREAADGLRHYLDGLEIDPQRLDWVERRVATIDDLARKHRVAPRNCRGCWSNFSPSLRNCSHTSRPWLPSKPP